MVAEKVVILDGFAYHIVGDVRATQVKDDPLPFVSVNSPARSKRTSTDEWFIQNFDGLGLKHIDLSDPNLIRGLLDSTVDTSRPDEGFMASPKIQNPTVPAATLHVVQMLEARGSLFAIGDSGATGTNGLLTYDGATDTWSSEVQAGQFQAIVRHGGFTFFLAGGGTSGATGKKRANNSTSYTDVAANTGSPTNGAAFSTRDTLYAVCFNNTELLVEQSTDDGVNWTILARIPSTYAATGAVVFVDPNLVPTPYIVTREGLWILDIANSRAEMIIPFDNVDSRNGVGLAVFDGQLIIPRAEGIIAMNPNGQYEPIGPNLRSGLPEDRRGKMTASTTSSDWLYLAYGGQDANRFACIYKWNRRQGMHHVYKHITADKEINCLALSEQDDGISRLHAFVEVSDTDSDALAFLYPLINPIEETAYKFEDTETQRLSTPWYDGGSSHIKKNYYAIAAVVPFADANDTVTIRTFADDSDSVVQTLDAIVASGVTIQELQNGLGQEAYNMRFAVDLAVPSGGATSPRVRYLVLFYTVLPDARWQYEFDLSVADMASETRTVEDIISTLRNLLPSSTSNSRQLKAFSGPAQGPETSINVRVTDIPNLVELADALELGSGEREGAKFTVVVLEPV